MKFIWLIVFCFFFVNCVDAKVDRDGHFRYNKFVYISIDKILTLQFVEDSIYSTKSKFGNKIFEELVFGKYVLPRKIGESYYPVDRIVGYLGTLSNRSESGDQNKIVRRIETKERQSVFLFFYKEKLIDYSVFNEYFISPDSPKTEIGKNATLDVRKKYATKDLAGGWPESYCDEKYYYYKSGREKEFVETYLAESCAWENPDFEVDLKKSGYYDRKNEMDRGDYSHLLKTQSMIQKW
ncbi:hypothetical protein [Leptospira santarosai]|uniref:hypothetical protein n=1 Tax=Leptospira santarosai TaxID=28183 RepID=UPI0026E2B312|nr:hypothetical protein [Leptospira santarosai]MDO6384542.1 hypothetical protein [Leptospira santarosai]